MPRKGVVPPQLRPFLFKKGKRVGRAARRVQRTVVQVARRSRRRGGRRSRSSGAAIPLVPTLVATSPEILVGVKAAQEIAAGVPGGVVGENSLGRLGQLYGGPTKDPNTMGLKENVTMKVIGAVSHIIMRKAGLRVRLTKRLTLF